MEQKNAKHILEKIHNGGLKFLSPQTLRETYQLIVHEAVSLVDGDDGRIVIKKGRKITTIYASSSTPFAPIRKDGFTYRCFKENKAFVIQANTLNAIHPEVVKEGFKSAIFIPVTYEKKVIAVLIVRSMKKKIFNTNELRTLKLFGATASLAIKKTQSYEETKKALETRDLFINLAAHELRTPLTSIKIYSELIKKNITPENKKLTTWSKQLSTDITHLAYLVNDLLQVEKIKKGKLSYHMEKQNIKKIIASAILDVQANFPEHKFIIKSNHIGASYIRGDFEKLVELFINVLGNAAKFSSTSQPIFISFSSANKHIHVSVIDKGKGIPKEELTKIFQKFYKARHTFEDGMGLGLFLSKNIIEKHQGKIHIDSKLHQGTTVKISLPHNN